MHALDTIILRNAAAAGREAAIADNQKDFALAGQILEADHEARHESYAPLALAVKFSEAFVAAYCSNRELGVK